VFAVNTDGASFAIFIRFTGGSDGAQSLCRIDSIGRHLVGRRGLAAVRVTEVFAVNTNGTGFKAPQHSATLVRFR
jgi:hypothetical protein